MKNMSMRSTNEYLRTKQKQYLVIRTKSEKSKFLDEVGNTTGFQRKYLISLLQARVNWHERIHRKRTRRSATYGTDVLYVVKKIWNILDCLCGQRLAPVLSETARMLVRHKELVISDKVMGKLENISSATLDRTLRPWKAGKRRRLHGTTKPGSLLKRQIPIQLSQYNVEEPGHSEIDLCAHNGGNASGDFAHTLVDTDLAFGWTEAEAFLGKAQKRVKKGLENIDSRRPFPRRSIDSDSGAEFINWLLYNFCQNERILFTRGRPGKKNDNPHVEEKNWTHIRKIVGYFRYDTQEQVHLLNDLYRNEWRLYENFFQPTLKLKHKKRIGGHLKRTYGEAKTPYQRAMESKHIKKSEKEKLRKIYVSLNPAELKRQIEQKLDRLFRTVSKHTKITSS